MVALIEKIIKCFLAVITYIGTKLVEKYPLWLFIVVCLVCVLLFSVFSCAEKRQSTKALVGSTEYKEHHYLVFRALDSNRTIAVVHDPDCPCNFVEPLEIEE